MGSYRNRWVGQSAIVLSRHRGDRWDLRNFIGVILSALLFTILLAAGAGECGRSFFDVDQSQREERGEHLLQDMLDAVSAYPFDRIAELADPSEFAPGSARDPDFLLDLGVTQMRRGLLRIEATLVDSSTHRQVGRFITYRSRT